MANRTKDYQDSRVARLNFAVLPSVKDDLITLASMRKITLNELGNQIFTEYIKKYEKRLAAYNELISGFDNEDVEAPVKKSQKSHSVKNAVSDEQKEEAIKKIISFINDNRDKIIDEKAKKTKNTIGYIIPARRDKVACIAVIAETVKFIDKDILNALKSSKITINRKKLGGLIRIEDSDLIEAFTGSPAQNEENEE